jgi:hypothetical protein
MGSSTASTWGVCVWGGGGGRQGRAGQRRGGWQLGVRASWSCLQACALRDDGSQELLLLLPLLQLHASTLQYCNGCITTARTTAVLRYSRC